MLERRRGRSKPVDSEGPDATPEEKREARIEAKKEERKERRRRRRSGADFRLKLHIPDEYREELEKTHYLRWCNEDMVQQRYSQDYDFVETKEVGVPAGEDPITGKPVGSRVTYSDKDGKKIYLMKKPREFHEEDRAELENIRNEREAVLWRGQQDKGDEERYVPKGGIKISRDE